MNSIWDRKPETRRMVYPTGIIAVCRAKTRMYAPHPPGCAGPGEHKGVSEFSVARLYSILKQGEHVGGGLYVFPDKPRKE